MIFEMLKKVFVGQDRLMKVTIHIDGETALGIFISGLVNVSCR